MTTSKRMKIVPLKERCICGKRVLNHHFYCDGCYGERQKKLNRNKDKWLVFDKKTKKWVYSP